ncbi:nuclear transport factor 2 family protein [Actinomycetospora lutea]|uniref:nuclear transport factor 2 family protein n=1 Tax=Actinomycetospora lutea TaxID=663604 RepID=UPI0023663F01|nr:nuclear transport factor 2 family protein [Actinomycetospora lutea]MDD7937467.1 nuclear transport factor 2 family protein [Actinomycetospora lutea]
MSADLADLQRRLEVLEAESALHRLRNRFHEYVNTDRWDEIGGLFAPDAELDYSYLGAASGRAAITEFFAAIPRLLPAGPGQEAGKPFVRQFIHGHDVAIDGDTATGTSFLFATPIYHGQSFVLAGRFADTYTRVAGAWLFARVALEIYYSVPVSEGWAGPDRHRMSL